MNPYNPNIQTNNKNTYSTHSGTTDKAHSNVPKATQAQPSNARIRQELTNAQSLINEAPPAHRKAITQIIHAKTHPYDLIALARTISDPKTQQRAWVIIGNKANIPVHIRLKAALNIQHEQTRKTILETLAKNLKINKFNPFDKPVDQLKQICSGIQDSPKEKKAILKAILHNTRNSLEVCAAAVELMGSPYEKNIKILGKYPFYTQIEEKMNFVMRAINLIESKNEREALVVELLCTFKDRYELTDKQRYALTLQNTTIKEGVFEQLLQKVYDTDYPESCVFTTIFNAHKVKPELLASFEWKADLFLKDMEYLGYGDTSRFFIRLISYIPQDKRDSVLETIFNRFHTLEEFDSMEFNPDEVRSMFCNLYNLASEEARETLLFAIASNNGIDENIRKSLIEDLTKGDDAKRDELAEIIEAGGSVNPKRKYTTKRAR